MLPPLTLFLSAESAAAYPLTMLFLILLAVASMLLDSLAGLFRTVFFSFEKMELDFLANFAIKKYKIKGGALAMRFGDTNYTGASVAHLHFHIISPKINKKTGRAKTVNFPIG